MAARALASLKALRRRTQNDLDVSLFGRASRSGFADPASMAAAAAEAAALEVAKLTGLRVLVQRLRETLALWTLYLHRGFHGRACCPA